MSILLHDIIATPTNALLKFLGKTLQALMKRHVYSTLAKLVVKEDNPDPIHYTRRVQTRKHKMNRTPVCPALRTGMVGETSFVCLYIYCTCFHILALYLHSNAVEVL